MSRIFVAGSITIKQIPDAVKARISNMIANELAILVGDANGVDSALQRFLAENKYARVCVYCSGKRPRNNLGNRPVRSVESRHPPGTPAFFTGKDIVMALEADYGFMIWDMESTGTLSNVLELLAAGKKSALFLPASQEFITVGDLPGCKKLAAMMTPDALERADQKMALHSRIAALEAAQAKLF